MSETIPIGSTLTFHASRDPRRPAYTLGDVTVSRGELDARANRRARMFAAEGVGRDDFVAIILPNGALFVEVVFAIWKLGAIPASLAISLADREREQILELMRPKFVVTGDGALACGHPLILTDRPIDEGLSTEALPPLAGTHWRATTSGGSTGRPKIIVSHGRTMLDPMGQTMRRKVDGVQLNTGPLYHSGPFSIGMVSLATGAHLIDGGKFDAENTLALIDKYKVDWVYFVPTMMNRIWRLPEEVRTRYNLSSIETMFHMAAACPDWLKRAWIDWLGPERIWELYSGAESSGVTIISGAEWLKKPGSVGKVQPGADLRILGPDGAQLPAGEIGEICFLPTAGQGATYHYIGADAKTFGEWETLGDMGHLDEDGYLFVADRRLDMIVSGGVNVYPAEVEAALERHPQIECAVVIGLSDADYGARVHAIVQPSHDADGLSEASIREFLVGQIMGVKIPKAIEIVTHPLRDDAGKVRRSALRSARMGEPAGSDAR